MYLDIEHRKRLKARALELLSQHQGPDDPISMTALNAAITGETVIPWRRYDQSRITRSLITELRQEGHAIAHKPGAGGGYYMARNEDELKDTAAWFRKRAMSSLRQEAALRRISLGALIEQYQLELKEEHSTHAQD
ncbi:hypothetical protein [Thioalkalivibrio sulfidiphilus]|uniref:hypothetical protein n=1 Tax=Thioalkalivibrio sulfidiphilus TaxID=1033854 RepID=UPI0001827E49|nr:hypothetical protein [Thioalkalivibrio sulfidiphilus]